MEEFPESDQLLVPDFGENEDDPAPDEMAPLEDPHERYLAELREEAEQKLQEAYREGYTRGLASGRSDFEERVQHSADALDQAAISIQESRQAFLDSLEPQVMDLVTQIVKKVLEREATTDTSLFRSTVARALARLADAQHVRLRLNPDDHKAIQDEQITFLKDFKGIESLDLTPDESITPGGCIAETDRMQVDARIETLLSNVFDTIEE